MIDEDRILEEIRAVRDSIAREHHHDVAEIVRWLKHLEARHGRQVVHLPARPAVVTRKVS
jgi:hypothetical protein